MKKIFTLLALSTLIVLLAQCSPKIAKMVTSEPILSKAEIENLYSSEQLNHGQSLYANNCSSCHNLHKADEYSQEAWNDILRQMLRYTNLDFDDAMTLRAYLMANAKDS